MSNIVYEEKMKEIDYPGDVFFYHDDINSHYYIMSEYWDGGCSRSTRRLINLSTGGIYSLSNTDPFDGKRDKYFSKCKVGQKIHMTVNTQQ